MLSQLLTAFTLGSSAILTNTCLLPLYPGLIAFLSGSIEGDRPDGRRTSVWLGALVLAGILSMMLVIGLILSLLGASFRNVLPVLLPLIYGVVIVMGVLMLMGRNPFARLAMAQAPLLRNPYLTAYAYGLLLGPMTLPCTGPLITGTFSTWLAGASGTDALVEGVLFFLAFGLGFGYPLVLLPLLALPVQRRLVSWLARHHDTLTRAAGVLMIGVGVFGIMTELVPQWVVGFEPSTGLIVGFWALVVALIAAVVWLSLRAAQPHDTPA